MKGLLNKLFKVGKYVQTVIGWLSNFEKAFKTLTAFKNSLELFESERKKIWGETVKVEPHTTRPVMNFENGEFVPNVDVKHQGGLKDELINDKEKKDVSEK